MFVYFSKSQHLKHLGQLKLHRFKLCIVKRVTQIYVIWPRVQVLLLGSLLSITISHISTPLNSSNNSITFFCAPHYYPKVAGVWNDMMVKKRWQQFILKLYKSTRIFTEFKDLLLLTWISFFPISYSSCTPLLMTPVIRFHSLRPPVAVVPTQWSHFHEAWLKIADGGVELSILTSHD